MSFNDIWNTDAESDWNRLFHRYWSLVKIDNIQVEYTLNRLTLDRVKNMDKDSWYEFLHDEYFFWKYTAKNRLATTRKHLQRYKDDGDLDSLDQIRHSILKLNTADIASSLELTCQVRGLGVAGASGLLSLLYPAHFATVDQFVVKALIEVPEHRQLVEGMNPEGLTIKNGVVLTQIMRNKAAENNARFQSDFWMPRTIEMALWAYRT